MVGTDQAESNKPEKLSGSDFIDLALAEARKRIITPEDTAGLIEKLARDKQREAEGQVARTEIKTFQNGQAVEGGDVGNGLGAEVSQPEAEVPEVRAPEAVAGVDDEIVEVVEQAVPAAAEADRRETAGEEGKLVAPAVVESERGPAAAKPPETARTGFIKLSQSEKPDADTSEADRLEQIAMASPDEGTEGVDRIKE